MRFTPFVLLVALLSFGAPHLSAQQCTPPNVDPECEPNCTINPLHPACNEGEVDCQLEPFHPDCDSQGSQSCFEACDAQLDACILGCQSSPPGGAGCFIQCTDLWHNCSFLC